jgi:hypothetical protein
MTSRARVSTLRTVERRWRDTTASSNDEGGKSTAPPWGGGIRNCTIERNASPQGRQEGPLVRRTQEPRDQRTGSIKCSYCVPGHIT